MQTEPGSGVLGDDRAPLDVPQYRMRLQRRRAEDERHSLAVRRRGQGVEPVELDHGTFYCFGERQVRWRVRQDLPEACSVWSNCPQGMSFLDS